MRGYDSGKIKEHFALSNNCGKIKNKKGLKKLFQPLLKGNYAKISFLSQ